MMVYNPNIHHRRSVRLKGYDYSQEGAYFVTICTQARRCLFGEIVAGVMRLNEFGQIANEVLIAVPTHYENVELGEYVIMPNHVHLIIRVGAQFIAPSTPIAIEPANNQGANNQGAINRAPTLGEIVRALKARVARKSNVPIWQRNYHEHIIRNANEYNRIAQYIINNPTNWENDELWNA
jgi:REP element-mobilizing transposase RayT